MNDAICCAWWENGCERIRYSFMPVRGWRLFIRSWRRILRRDGQDDAIGAYMSGYKAYKLGNRLPDDEALYFNGVQTDGYEHRYAALSRSAGENTVVLWIDALGVEWLPLLAWSNWRALRGVGARGGGDAG